MAVPKSFKSNRIVKFSQNWNSKLCGHSFSTIRLENHSKYLRNTHYLIMLKDSRSGNFIEYGVAKLVASSSFVLSQLSDTMSYLDADMSAVKLIFMLNNMYKNKVNDISLQRFNMLVFQFISRNAI